MSAADGTRAGPDQIGRHGRVRATAGQVGGRRARTSSAESFGTEREGGREGADRQKESGRGEG